jgi:hypothetical protein
LIFRDSAWLEAWAILHWHFVHAVDSIEEGLFLHIHRASAKIVTVLSITDFCHSENV